MKANQEILPQKASFAKCNAIDNEKTDANIVRMISNETIVFFPNRFFKTDIMIVKRMPQINAPIVIQVI